MKNDIYAEIKDKNGEIVYVGNYHPSFKESTLELFKEAYPDSFDKYDLEFIREFLGEWEEDDPNQGCLLAIIDGEIVGACLFEKVAGPQDQWEISYIFVRESFQRRGIGQILVGAQEEYLKNKARISFAINPGILPEDVISYPFWRTIGYELWAVLPGYFRDDLSGIFLVKRNPYYKIGRGIPKDSGWCPEMADSQTGKRIYRKEYQEILHSLKPTPKEKWGLDLIGRENVLIWNILKNPAVGHRRGKGGGKMIETAKREESCIKPKEFIKQALNSGEIKWQPKVCFNLRGRSSISLLKDGLPGPEITGYVGVIGNAEIEIKLDYLSGGRGRVGGGWGIGRGRKVRRGGWPPWISYPGSIRLSLDGKEVFCEYVGLIKNILLYRSLLKSAEIGLGMTG